VVIEFMLRVEHIAMLLKSIPVFLVGIPVPSEPRKKSTKAQDRNEASAGARVPLPAFL
jgi:hypothetical protein